MEDFKSNVLCGGFIDYDGFGRYASINKESDKIICPSHFKNNVVLEDEEFTHVMWYNR